MNITLVMILAKLPIEQISTTVRMHIEPLLRLMPDKRMGRVAEQIILGILGGQTPVITGMARQSSKDEGETWAAAKRIYRWMDNKRIKSQELFECLYLIGQQVVALENPEYLVVAVDPVNFEKPYAKAIEGVSVVHKATPPDLNGHARLTHGYPAITPRRPLLALARFGICHHNLYDSFFRLLAPFSLSGIYLWVITSEADTSQGKRI